MKETIKNVSIVLLIIVVIIKRDLIIEDIINAFNIWLTNLFPSLFPFLIISDFILSSNLINVISNLLNPIFNRFFGLSGYASYVFIMSLISGCPTNAKYIRDLLNDNLISKEEGIKILSMSLLYNPILILTITSYLNPFDQYLVIFGNIGINLMIGFINRKVKCNYNSNIRLIPKKFNLIQTINNTIQTLFLVLGAIAFFIALASLIPFSHPLISGIFEITSGIKQIYLVNSYALKLVFTGMLLSFGGLSIHLQIKSILNGFNLEYSLFYKSRIIHLGLFLLLIHIRLFI